MNETFDPYRKWLGIPPEDQPPHHYRLLGIEPFESDPDVITSAADGRMAQVRNFQLGKYSGVSQRILNEIATAKLCLLSAKKKKRYDRELGPRLEAEKKAIPNAAPPAGRGPKLKTGPTAETPIPAIETSSVFCYVSTRSPKRRSWLMPAVLGVGAVAVVVLVFFLLGRGNRLPVAQPPPPSEAPSTAAPPEASIPVTPKGPPPKTEDQQDAPPPVAETEVARHRAEPPAEPEVTPPAIDPGRPLADLLDPPDPARRRDDGPRPTKSEPPARDLPIEDAATLPKRLPPPDDDARRQAEQRIREIFRTELAEATTPEKRLALAAKLADQAEKMADDPAARFALMHFACEEAADAGGLTMTLDLADRVRQLYDVNALSWKASLLEKAAAETPPPAANRQIVDQTMALVAEAVAAESFDLAGRLVKLALSAGRKMKDPGLLQQLEARDREIGRMELRFLPVRKALDVLTQNPSDGAANLMAGRWYCFTVGNWGRGLPLLAKGADAELAQLAKQDLDGPENPPAQRKLGDQWWGLARNEKGPEQRGIQARAQRWYELALPGLTGLEKTEVEKRLTELAASVTPSGTRIRGVVQEGNVALASNGTTVSGQITRAPEIIDGKTETIYEPAKGYASSRWPCEWLITFDKVYQLSEIRLKLLDKFPQYFNYTLAASVDGRNFTMVADRSQGQWASWQRIRFPPLPVKQIKLNALHNTRNQWFCVIEFEAYCIPPASLPQ